MFPEFQHDEGVDLYVKRVMVEIEESGALQEPTGLLKEIPSEPRIPQMPQLQPQLQPQQQPQQPKPQIPKSPLIVTNPHFTRALLSKELAYPPICANLSL